MKQLLTILLFFMGFSVQAQEKKIKTEPEGLLWEISGNALKENSFLFGTYHLIGKNFTDTLPGLMQRFQGSKTVVGEIVMESEMAMAQKMMPFMLLKDSSLDKILSPSEYKEVDSLLTRKAGLQLVMLNGLKPAAVQLTLVSFLAPKDISPTNPALDLFFQSEAKSAGKGVVGLETVEGQADMLMNTPLEQQKKDLLKTVRESERMVAESKALHRNYVSGNLQAIERLILESSDMTEEERVKLITNRNRAWAQKIPALLTTGPVFIAVGAGHLPGKDGLIELLRSQGYTLRPVPLK